MVNEGRRSQYFVAGGTLRPSVPSYVKRPSDDELFSLARDGEFCYVLTPRQMGKSSLMIRTARRLQDEGVHTVIIDLTEIGLVSIDEWYLGLITEIQRSLRLELDASQWWLENQHLGQPQRFRDFLQNIILKEVDYPIVIFIDEIDSTLKLDFRDDFFAVIRGLYNNRSHNPELNRLSFVLLGVASPSDLIKDRTRTPFNIGHEIDIKEISYEDAQVLIHGLDNIFLGNGAAIFDRIYYWTSGHPYLTQKLCVSVTQSPDLAWENSEIDLLVNRTFITDEARGETNIQFVNDFITTHPQKMTMLKIYRQVYKGQEIKEEKTIPEQGFLKLSGLVKVDNGYLVVRNQIYHDAFDLNWIKENSSVNWRLLATIALIIIIVLASISFVAIAYARTAQANAQVAISARETAVFSEDQANNSRETAVFSEDQANNSRATAVADSELRSTAEAIALEQQAIAVESANQAIAAQATAEAIAAELEIALQITNALRVAAEADERTARSRELANIAQQQINSSPSFALLLALEATNILLSFKEEIPPITESVLHNTLQALQLRRVLSRHTDEVTDVAVSPDGSTFATVSLDQTVKIWDTASGQEIKTLERGHGRSINTVAYHPTQNILATGGDDGFVILWDLDRGTSKGVLPHGTNNPVREVTFSPDGTQVAAVTADNALHLWETDTRLPIKALDGHNGALTDVAYSQDDRFLATTSEDGSIILRDATSNAVIQSINPTFADEPRRDDGSVASDFIASAVTFSPDNNTLAAAFGNGIILTSQTGSWQELATFSGHSSRINELVFAPDGQRLGSASNDKTAKVYDVATTEALFTLSGHLGGISAIAFTPDGKTIITTSKDGTVRLWNDKAGLTPHILTGHRDTIQALDFSADGSKIASGGLGKNVYIWDAATNGIIARLTKHTGAINDVAFHPTNANILATVSDDTQAFLWDLNTGQVLEPAMDHDAEVTAVTFNPDGTMLITGSSDGLVTFWDTQAHQRLFTLENESQVRDVAISSDGLLLAVGLENNTTVIWNIENNNNQIQTTLAEHEGPVNSVAFSSDNQLLATGSEDDTAKIWDMATGEILRTLTGHSSPITDITFHPDPTDNRIATSSVDGTMKLWNIEGELLRNFTGHAGAVNRVVFSPDTQTIATASADRTIRLNRIAPIAELFARGLALATRSLTPEECAQYVRQGECLSIGN